MSMQVDNWLNQRPFDGPAEKAPQAQGPVIVIGAGPAGLAAATHLKVSKQQLRFSGICSLANQAKERVIPLNHSAIHLCNWF